LARYQLKTGEEIGCGEMVGLEDAMVAAAQAAHAEWGHGSVALM
jgi:hypothetical protein